MTKSELERLERIAVQLLAGVLASDRRHETPVAIAIAHAETLIKQLDAFKIPE